MDELNNFLALPDVDNITKEVYINKRIGNVTVRAMTQDTYNDYINRCRSKFSKKGMDFDAGKFQLLMVANQTAVPDFSNADLLKKANCATATELVTRKLLAGEIAQIAAAISEISGFDSSTDELVEEAKN